MPSFFCSCVGRRRRKCDTREFPCTCYQSSQQSIIHYLSLSFSHHIKYKVQINWELVGGNIEYGKWVDTRDSICKYKLLEASHSSLCIGGLALEADVGVPLCIGLFIGNINEHSCQFICPSARARTFIHLCISSLDNDMLMLFHVFEKQLESMHLRMYNTPIDLWSSLASLLVGGPWRHTATNGCTRHPLVCNTKREFKQRAASAD